MNAFLDFEKPIAELEGKIKELRHLAEEGDVNIAEEVSKLEAKAEQQLRQTYANLTAWQKTLVARHQDRPHMSAYVDRLIEDFTALAGDRAYAEDRAVCGGLGRFRGRSVMVLGHEKGDGTDGRVRHNFGMPMPEGYRKAVRLMHLAERFRLPVISFVDTPGAHPGVGAEERGQSEAIARSIEACLSLTVPLVAVIIGEGGSGGAVALATGNRICMLEHAIYSVITPEGCASILWRSAERAQDAAEAMKLTAQDLARLKVIDEVVAEPIGGAHRLPEVTIKAVGEAIAKALDDLVDRAPDTLRAERQQKFIAMGRAEA